MATTYDSGWWEGSKNYVELVGLKNPDTDAFVGDATVTVKMIAADGTVVSSLNGVSVPVVDAPAGTYRLETDVELVSGVSDHCAIVAALERVAAPIPA